MNPREILSIAAELRSSVQDGNTTKAEEIVNNPKYAAHLKEIINAKNPFNGRTAVMNAAARNNSRLAKLFLDNGADLIEKNEEGKITFSADYNEDTAFILAARKGNLDLVKWILAYYKVLENEFCLDVGEEIIFAIDCAASEHHPDVVKYLAKECKSQDLGTILESKGLMFCGLLDGGMCTILREELESRSVSRPARVLMGEGAVEMNKTQETNLPPERHRG